LEFTILTFKKIVLGDLWHGTHHAEAVGMVHSAVSATVELTLA